MEGIDKARLIPSTRENQLLLQSEDKCDKYDYLAAVACGALGGIIDIFLVGAPGDSALGNWTDTQIDNVVMLFAKKVGWAPKPENAKNVKSAIGYLEKNFRVNYDQKNTTEVGGLFQMAPKNHHMKSLPHSPDPIGLFFSILNQFTSTSTFIANGQIITISTDTFELQGGNFIAKIFCGVANWFGHLISDIAGSSGSRGNGGRGTGIVMPFYELFGLCKFGRFSVGKDKQDLATIATRAFQEGYDFRFGLAQTIPVVITDLSIRLIWSIRRHFQYKKPLNECIPTKKHADLRVMLLFGASTLCIVDGIDAGIRSGGNFLLFFMRLNIVAWFRLAMLVLKEVCIRVGIADALQMNIEAYKRINAALRLYLEELEQFDIEQFKKETEEYNRIASACAAPMSEAEWNILLLKELKILGIHIPWNGEFDKFMGQKTESLVFK